MRDCYELDYLLLGLSFTFTDSHLLSVHELYLFRLCGLLIFQFSGFQLVVNKLFTFFIHLTLHLRNWW